MFGRVLPTGLSVGLALMMVRAGQHDHHSNNRIAYNGIGVSFLADKEGSIVEGNTLLDRTGADPRKLKLEMWRWPRASAWM